MAVKALTGWSRVGRSGGNYKRDARSGAGRADTAKDKREQKESDRRAQAYYDRTGEWGWGPGS